MGADGAASCSCPLPGRRERTDGLLLRGAGSRVAAFLLLAALHEDERAEAEVGEQPADEFPRELPIQVEEARRKLTILPGVTLSNCAETEERRCK